jgi:hypothetical protein
MRPAPDRPAPLILVATPSASGVAPPPGSYASVAHEGQALLAAELSIRLARLGAAVAPLETVVPSNDEAFHWGRWFAAGARPAVAEAERAGRPLDAIGYAGSGAVALLDDDGLESLLRPSRGEAVANNRFSADAFVVAGEPHELERALSALEACPGDNAAPRCLDAAGFGVRDLGAAPFARFDVDTPLDLALLRLATRLPGTRDVEASVAAFLESARLPGDRPLEVPHLDAIGSVMRDRDGELLVAGRVPASAWAHLETETACRVRCFIEERGMRSAPAGRPRSLLAALLRRSSPAELVGELAALGDAVICDSRVIMAALAASPEPESWPPEEERFASDLGDGAAITTPWLHELVAAAADAPIPFLLGGHALVSDGLRLIVAAAWLGR